MSNARTPIETMLAGVAWTPSGMVADPDDDTPYATHSGVLELLGHRLRVYRLSSGQAIIHADDMEALFGFDAQPDSGDGDE